MGTAIPSDGRDAFADIPVPVREQAVEWLMELQADSNHAGTRERWQQWRQAHPDHERAWQCVAVFGDKLRLVPSPLAHAALASAGRSRRQVVKTLAVVVFAGSAALALQDGRWRQWAADKRTGVGEQSRVTLPDGTRIVLNSSTAIDVRFSSEERVVRLLGGEVYVATAHEQTNRPFLVETAHGRVRALGTRFTVREASVLRQGASDVAVFEGAVQLQPRRAGAQALVLAAGRTAVFDSEAAFETGTAVEDAAAWTEGMIVAQDMPLAQFLAELARHRPGRLACDPAAAQLRVSGTYPLADTDRVLDMLARTLPVRLRSLTRYWVTVEAAPG